MIIKDAEFFSDISPEEEERIKELAEINVILFLVNLLAETVKAFFGGMYPLFWTAGPGRFMLYGVMILLFVAALYLAFVYICLLFRKGTEGPNPFGADPLAPPAEE